MDSLRPLFAIRCRLQRGNNHRNSPTQKGCVVGHSRELQWITKPVYGTFPSDWPPGDGEV